MSYLLETLGRGLLGQLLDAFEHQLPSRPDDDAEVLAARHAHASTSVDLAMRLGLAQLRNLQLAAARSAFDTAYELSDRKLQPALGLACVYDELGRLDEALRYLAIAQACDPQDPAVTFALGFCHERRGELDATVANYRRALELCPRLRNAHERLAAIAVKRGDWDEAIRHYRQLAELEPDDLDVLMTLAALYLQTDQPIEAIEKFQRALLVEPECGSAPFEESEQLSEAGRLAEAIDTLERLCEKYPGVADFHVHLGDLHVKAGDDDAAVTQYRAALDVQPNFLEATVKLGTQHMRQGRFADAARAFNRAVELNDRLMTAFVGLGVSQRAAGRTHEAQATFELAASLEPNTTLLFSETTRLQLRSEPRRPQRGAAADIDAEPASDELLGDSLRRHRQALLAQPNHADLHYRHGLLLRQAGEFADAIEAFRKAIEINPHYVKALIKLGICLNEAGRCDEAFETFERTLRLGRKFVDVHYELGLLFAQRNRFDLAVEQFEQAVAGNGRNLAFRQNLALALQNIGMLDRASATWRSICELSGHTPPIELEQRITAVDTGPANEW